MSPKTAVLTVAAALLAALTLPGAGGSRPAAAGKLRVIITDRGALFSPGTFVLSGPAGSDSGTSGLAGSPGPAHLRDGQEYELHRGTDTLSGKKGDLTIAFVGTSVKAAEKVYIEYGTWHIDGTFSTGTYKQWLGGGRWAATDDERHYSIRFEGFVTR